MTGKQEVAKLPQNELNNIKHVIAVMSGKGGVGKSTVAALLAVEASREGYTVGVMDADVTGPSIPRMFGIREKAEPIGLGSISLIAPRTKRGVRVMSINLLLDQEDDPVIWRGPLIASAVKQFWTDVLWGDLDYLIVDLPPGTGDAPLTVMQSLPVEGVVIVSSPQDLAAMVVRKAIKMVQRMNVPVLGLIENMSFVRCPKCGEEIYPFGKPSGKQLAERAGVKYLGSIPIDSNLAKACDRGEIEDYAGSLGVSFANIVH